MPQLLVNNAHGTLTAGINSSQTSITVNEADTIPSSLAADEFLLLTLFKSLARYDSDYEVVKVTAISEPVAGTRNLTVERGYEGTAQAFSSGDKCEARLTKRTFENIQAQTEAGFVNKQLREALLEQATLISDFANNRYRVYQGLADGMTELPFEELWNFTRNSDAYGNGPVKLERVTSDTKRLVYSLSTKERLGLLTEALHVNKMQWNEDLTNAVWGKTNVTITPNDVVAPNGELTADRVVEEAINAVHYISYENLTATAGEPETVYFYVHAAERAQLEIQIDNNDAFTNDIALGFDLDTEETYSGNVGIAPDSFKFEKDKNGFYFCSITATPGASGTYRVFVILNDSSRGRNYNGDSSSGLHLWRGQSEQSAYPTSSIFTEGAQGTRAADLCIRTLAEEFNNSKGTLYVNAEYLGNPTTPGGFYALSDGTNNNRILIAFDPSASTGGGDKITVFMRKDSGVNASIVSDIDGAQTNLHEIALAWDETNIYLTVDGVDFGEEPHNGVPIVNFLDAQGDSFGSVFTITKETALFVRNLSTAERKALTTGNL